MDEPELAQYALPERLALPMDFGVHQTLSQEPAREKKSKVEEETDAIDYLKDVAYGGPQGLAYARSVMEFINGATRTNDEEPSTALREWVDENVLDPATSGLHTVLDRSTATLRLGKSLNPQEEEDSISQLLHDSLVADPIIRSRVAATVEFRKESIRLLQLVKDQADLLASDSIWDPEAPVTVVDPNEPNIPIFSAKWASRALKLAADRIEALGDIKAEPEAAEPDDVRQLRLNLLALAKFVPLSEGVQLN